MDKYKKVNKNKPFLVACLARVTWPVHVLMLDPHKVFGTTSMPFTVTLRGLNPICAWPVAQQHVVRIDFTRPSCEVVACLMLAYFEVAELADHLFTVAC